MNIFMLFNIMLDFRSGTNIHWEIALIQVGSIFHSLNLSLLSRFDMVAADFFVYTQSVCCFSDNILNIVPRPLFCSVA